MYLFSSSLISLLFGKHFTENNNRIVFKILLNTCTVHDNESRLSKLRVSCENNLHCTGLLTENLEKRRKQ